MIKTTFYQKFAEKGLTDLCIFLLNLQIKNKELIDKDIVNEIHYLNTQIHGFDLVFNGDTQNV